MTTGNIIVFILLTVLFTLLEPFVYRKIKLIEILKQLPIAVIVSIILIAAWHIL